MVRNTIISYRTLFSMVPHKNSEEVRSRVWSSAAHTDSKSRMFSVVLFPKVALAKVIDFGLSTSKTNLWEILRSSHMCCLLLKKCCWLKAWSTNASSCPLFRLQCHLASSRKYSEVKWISICQVFWSHHIKALEKYEVSFSFQPEFAWGCHPLLGWLAPTQGGDKLDCCPESQTFFLLNLLFVVSVLLCYCSPGFVWTLGWSL